MAINQNHDYKQVYDQTYELVKKAVGDGATNGGRDGLVKALSNLEIDGTKVDINTKSVQKVLDDALQKGFSNFRARGFKVASIDFADIISLDAKSLQSEINKALKEIEIHPENVKVNRRLYGLAATAVAKGLNLTDAKGARIDKEYVKGLEEFARITEAQADMIQKKFADVMRSIDVSELVKELIDAANQMEKVTDKIEQSTKKAKEAKQAIDKATKNTDKKGTPKKDSTIKEAINDQKELNKQLKETAQNQQAITQNKGSQSGNTAESLSASSISAMTKEATDSANDMKQLAKVLSGAFEDFLHVTDKFKYASNINQTNPLNSFIDSFAKGDVSLDEAKKKAEQIKQFNQLIEDAHLPRQAVMVDGISAFEASLKDIGDGTLDAQQSYEKFVAELRQGSNLLGNEGHAVVNNKSSLEDLEKEYIRLQSVIESTKDSSNKFEQRIAEDANQGLERVAGYRRKLTHHLNSKGEWVPNEVEKTGTERDFSSPEWQQAITNLFNKSEETKQEVDKVTSGLDEMGQTGATAGDKVAEGMKVAKEEAQKVSVTYEDIISSLGNVANVVANIRRGEHGVIGFPDAQSYENLKSKYGSSNIKGIAVAPSEQTAQRNIKAAYDIFENALRKFDIGEGDESYIKNVYANVKDIIDYNARSLVKGETDFRKALEDSLPKRNKRVQTFIDTMVSNNELMNKIASQEDDAFQKLYTLGEGRTTEVKKPKLSVKLGNRPKEYQVQQIDTSQYLSSMQQELIPMLNPRSDQYDLYGALEKICGALGIEIPEASDKAVAAIKEHIETCEYDEEVINRLGKTVDKYSGVLGKNYSNTKLSDIKGDLSKGWGQFQQFADKNKGLIPDPNTLNEEGVRAGYLYLNAFQEVLKRGSKDSKSLGFRPLEMDTEIGGHLFGKAKDNKWLEEQVNLYRQRLELIVRGNQIEKEKPIIDTTAREVKSEAEAHKENAENIQKEAEAKKESRVEDEKKVSVDDEMARYQQYIAELQRVRDEKKAIYDEEAAHLRELQIKSDAIFAQSQDTRKYDHYKESYKNAKRDNFDFIKDQPVSHVDALWQRFVDHGKRYLNTGDDAALGKAAGYYKQYADAVREAGEEVQRAKIGQNDLTDKLVSEAEVLERTKGITFDRKELAAVNIEIGKVRENVDKLEAEYDKAQKKLDKAESEMMAAQLSPVVQQQLQLREEADKTTAAVKKQKEAMQAPKESMDKVVESEKELVDVEEKVAEKAKEAADAKEQEKAAGDNSKAVEQEKEEETAIEKKTAARQRSLEVKKEEQKSGDSGKTTAQIEEETDKVNKLNAVYERRLQQQKESQTAQTPVVIKAEDLSPVLMQLTNIIGLLERKNNLFIREGSIVAEQAAKESSALQGVANVLKEIVGDLQALNGKGVKLSFTGLNNLKQLTELDVNKLDERLIGAFDIIADFAKELGKIKVDDSSFVKSINNMLKHGEELKNLATALKASKEQIDNVTEAISKPKEQSKTKVDLSEWKELNKVVKEYYELKNTDSDKLTQSEQGRLTEIEGLWAKVRGEVEKTTAALKEQGQSTKLIEDVTRAYTAGFAEWQNQQVLDARQAEVDALKKKVEPTASGSFVKRLNDYPSKYVEEAATQVQSLKAMVAALNAKPIDVVTDEEISDAQKLAAEIQQGFNSADWKVANQTKVSNLQNEISMYMKNFSALSEETKEKLRALNEELDHVGSNEGLAQAVQKFNKIKIAARDAGEEGTSFFSKMGKQIEHLNAQAFAMYLSWQDIIRYIRQAAGAVIELDSALTELRKVSDAGTERLQQSFETSAKTAKELGNTVTNVINSTSSWARMGYDIGDAEELARITTLYQNVGDGISQEDASESLISTLQGYRMAAEDAEGIIDVFNEVGNRFAITSGGIGESLKRSAAAFNVANTDLQKSVALIAGTNEVVQDVDAIGAMWTTVSARIRGADSELQSLGEDTDEYVESTSKLRNLVKGITGVDIMQDENTFKDIYTIVTQIAEKWDSISDINQANEICLYVQKCA